MHCSPPSRLRREWRGLFVLGGTEVSPIYDPTGATSLTAANLLFDMLWVLSGISYSE